MSNGHANCIFAVCCPPESEDRVIALADEIAKANPGTEHPSGSATIAHGIAKWVLATYDLAPKGSLTPLYAEIARLARQGYVLGEALHQGQIVVEGEVKEDPGLSHNDMGD